ncbi:2-haloacid dehalogenase [Ureibacillus xyleni]|uniref:2-haloacid dehalogenase n=1 Tax=Ureibacillus xyleni TaxID=614648 RepID=A0A285SX89_9BACL|nr:YjjG family noncanonical pyrimidine nucleotidase [Ureibacillus xyleni]SOC13260.1 2-haloacid dehalogenase [Ureibacillus xyleni]
MKRYKTLLFDLDDTLLDFGATEDAALQKLFSEQEIELTPEIRAYYKDLNDRLWKAFEVGDMEREEVVNSRFSLLFEHYGLNVDGVALEKRYRTFLAEGHHLIEGALELVQDIYEQFDLYVVTNGESNTQYKRLKDSGLERYFKKVFISEEVGHQKPRKEFFDYVFSNIEELNTKSTLIIGDSLSADITGGHNAGIDTCWINIRGKENNTTIIPTYEIKKLDELYEVLNIK